jgi:hydrogenase maturation protease
MPADPAPILLFAYGNISRGDDALAPRLLERLRQSAVNSLCGHPLRLVEDYQIQVEHALDLQGCAAALLVDAHRDLQRAFSFYRLAARRDTEYTTHGMSPEALLATYQQTFAQAPPPSYLLAIAGQSFELGEPLSQHAVDNLESALRFCLDQLRVAPEVAAWDNLFTT